MSQILKAAPQSCFPLLKTISKMMYRFFKFKHLPLEFLSKERRMPRLHHSRNSTEVYILQ